MDGTAFIAHIQQTMREAMKNRDQTTRDALQSLLARISSAEAVAVDTKIDMASPTAGASAGVGSTEAPRKLLTVQDVHAVIAAEKQEIEATLSRIDASSDYAAELRAKITVLERLQ